jgi:ribosomal protein L11
VTFAEKLQIIINKGVAASMDLATKVGEKAKDLGAKGVLKLEIVQLESQAEKLIAKLGSEVYITLVDKDQATVSRDTPSIRAILKEIEQVRERNEQKEKEYRSIGGKQETSLDVMDRA